MSFLSGLLGKGSSSLIEGIGGVVDKFVTTKEEKAEMKRALLEVVSKDKDSARNLYAKDSWLQKVYGVVFLLGYIFVSIYLINILTATEEVNTTTSTFMTMIFTAMSMKVNTITDFLFGGSLSQRDDDKRK